MFSQNTVYFQWNIHDKTYKLVDHFWYISINMVYNGNMS